MIVIPAVDIRGGKAVRLVEGRFDAETVFDADPVAAALRWRDAGAERLHVVDLDGAVSGAQANAAILAAMLRAVAPLPVQVGGGLRDLAAIETVLAAGAGWAVLGTAALEQPDLVREATARFPGKILAGIDARDGRVTVRGWLTDSNVDAQILARTLAHAGVAGVIHTDVRRDGTGAGPNLEATAALASSCPGLPVIASGGVGTLDHVRAAARLAAKGIAGIIVGRALYDGRFSLAEAQTAARIGESASAG